VEKRNGEKANSPDETRLLNSRIIFFTFSLFPFSALLMFDRNRFFHINRGFANAFEAIADFLKLFSAAEDEDSTDKLPTPSFRSPIVQLLSRLA
jgi:hypothetical protein